MSGRVTWLCPGCGSPLTEPFIQCAECRPQKVNICLRCFARGLQLRQHHSDHKYEVVKNDFQLFKGGWTAAEELQLLEAIADCGIGNWSDVASQLQTRSRNQCERHYNWFFLTQPCSPLPAMTEAEVTTYPCPVPHKVCEDPPRPSEGSTLQFDMSGYMAARGDFMVEHDNYAEMNLRDIEFTGEDGPLLTGMKGVVVDVYENVLRERQRRKRILRDHGLINMSKHIVSHRKYDKTMSAITMETLKVFRRLLTFEGWEKLMESLHYASELRHDIRRLAEYREAGLTHFHSASVYERLKARREEEQSQKTVLSDVLALIQNQSTATWNKRHSMMTQLSKGHYSQSMPSVSRKAAVPLDILGLPGSERLTDPEKELCSSARLVPNSYLEFKSILMSECRRYGFLRLAQARNLIKIDVNKTRKLYDFLIQQGHVTREPPLGQ